MNRCVLPIKFIATQLVLITQITPWLSYRKNVLFTDQKLSVTEENKRSYEMVVQPGCVAKCIQLSNNITKIISLLN